MQTFQHRVKRVFVAMACFVMTVATVSGDVGAAVAQTLTTTSVTDGYAVTLVSGDGGFISFADGDTATTKRVAAGSDVDVSVVADDGWALSALSASDADDNVSDLELTDGTATLTNVSSDTVVSAVFYGDGSFTSLNADVTATDVDVETASDYIKNHADSRFVGTASEPSAVDVLTVTTTLVDTNTFTGTTLDELWDDVDGDGIGDGWTSIAGQGQAIVVLYDAGDGDNYVAQVRSDDDTSAVLQALAGRNDTTGTVYDDVVYDDATGLVYVPKHYLSELGVANGVRLQLLVGVVGDNATTPVDVVVDNDGVHGDVAQAGVADVPVAAPTTSMVGNVRWFSGRRFARSVSCPRYIRGSFQGSL